MLQRKFVSVLLVEILCFILATFINSFSQTPNPDSIPFADKVDYETGGGPWGLFISDLDNDGDNDLVVTNSGPEYGGTTISVLKNNGDGTFAAKVDYDVGITPREVFASDLDGDGDQDLAVANSGSNTVSILRNNGDGTFANKIDYGTGSYPISIFAADIDGDTDRDLMVANYGSNTVSVLRNLSINCSTKSGDVTGDGKVSSSDIFYLFNYYFKKGPAPSLICMGDVNADGKISSADIVYFINYYFKNGPSPLKSGICCL